MATELLKSIEDYQNKINNENEKLEKEIQREAILKEKLRLATQLELQVSMELNQSESEISGLAALHNQYELSKTKKNEELEWLRRKNLISNQYFVSLSTLEEQFSHALASLKKNESEKQNDIVNMVKKSLNYEEKMNSLNESIETLESEITHETSAISEIESKIEECSSDLHRMTDEIINQRKFNAELERKLQIVLRRVEQSKIQKENLNAEYAEMKSSLEKYNSDIDEKRKELVAAKNLITKYELELHHRNGELYNRLKNQHRK